MTGIVKLVNNDKKLLAAQTGHGDYVILRLINPVDTVDIGDKLEGELTMMGEQSIFNITKAQRVKMDIEETYLTFDTAQAIIS